MPSRDLLELRAARAFGLKDYEKAIDALSDLLSVIGENPNTLHAAAVCHQRLGRHGEALEFAKRGISVDPIHLGCLEILTESHVARGELEAAKVFARRALACANTEPSDDETLRNPGVWLASMLKSPQPVAGQRAPNPEWLSWAAGLLKSGTDAGKS